MKRIALIGDINAITGYGLHGIQIVRDLERLSDVYVAVRCASRWEPAWGEKIPDDIKRRIVYGPQPEPWEILLHPPNFVPTPGKQTVYFTMHESTKLPPMGPHLLNKAEVVVVPCAWNASCFSACGVTKPIRVVPLGIKTDVFHWRPMPTDFPEICRFGAAGRMAHGGVRKGLNDVIALFQKAFPRKIKNVRLTVKCFPDCGIKPVNDSRIEILAQHMTETQLADWFASLTAFVSMARGEGWGLMQHQAMATGRPLIASKFGGLAEFFDSSCGWNVPYRIELAQHAYEGQGHWAEPNADDMISAMRGLFYARETAPTIGALAANRVAPLSWEASNCKLAHVLHEFGAL